MNIETERLLSVKHKSEIIFNIQVCTFHDGCKQGIDRQIFYRKSISRKITHPQSWKCKQSLQVKS